MIQDTHWDTWIHLPRFLAEDLGFDLATLYERQLAKLLEFFICPDPPPRHSGCKPDDDSGGGSSVAVGKA